MNGIVVSRRLKIAGNHFDAEIIKAVKSGEIPDMEIACVISSKDNAGGLEKAKNLGVPETDIVTIDPHQVQFSEKLLEELRKRGVTVVTQNGWMPKTPENVIKAFKDKIFNQHPGPVPEFGGEGMYGRRVHAAVLLYRRWTLSSDWRRNEHWTEVIAQRVDKDFDKGAVLKRVRVAVLPTDTVEDLQGRALPVEHRLQIELLKDVAKGTIKELGKRQEIITSPSEKLVWELSKKTAILLYPEG
ncbi:MAG: Phosphoribosylglycinamide formyltransferase [Candidatus Daviesbacteria bacterium GW2011_GWA1_42_6]|uniref:phosphoribosylglycinamide formyltransferase 1 n=1 Tax=Candidatus Daviesbacteria bacterium GW2011_GWA1_42_6 TaxID=1618420 RepID=A0A0G1ATC4_9BACT|nr:MAG: Phosphoribosylglycinamide formyltransferase [Candidatus Daviesbacteria bacterium GW2011_GWA1_42_6]